MNVRSSVVVACLASVTAVRLPCPGVVMPKNGALPKGPVPRTYRLVACAPQHRFSVSIIVLS